MLQPRVSGRLLMTTRTELVNGSTRESGSTRWTSPPGRVTRQDSVGDRAGDEDAERVAGRVGVDPEWLLWIVGPIPQQTRSQGQRPAMLGVPYIHRRHRKVQMQHL